MPAAATAEHDAYGYERRIVFKSVASSAETLRAVPEPNWRGIGASIQVKRPRGAAARSIVLGVPSATQTVALRANDATDAGTAKWRLTLGEDETADLIWKASANDVAQALEKMSPRRGLMYANIRVITTFIP